MKSLLPCLLLILLSFASIAQDQVRTPKPKPVKKKKPIYETVDQVVKLNIPSLLMRTLAVQYEKKLSPSKTIALGVIYRPNFPTPIINILLKDTNFTASAETMYMLKSSKYNTLMITPEFRFYFKKKAPRGLYLAPFLRYKKETLTANFRYQESALGSNLKVGEYKNKSNAIGAGLLFGIQILTKKKVTIDFWFLGPWAGINFVSNESKINTSNLNEFDKAYIESSTESYNNAFGFSNKYEWSSKGFSNSDTKFGIGVRMFGINIGYSF